MKNNMGNNSSHYTVGQYSIDGNHALRPKVGFDTELKAQKVCFELNLKPETIHKAVSYKCPVYGKTLTSSDKQKIREQYTKWKFVHQCK
mgnify:CR=1 FL=1